MTLGVAWIRNIGDVQEIAVASDSRLANGIETWQSAPKIVALPRTDAVISFAGVTELAYPVMLQVARAVETNPAHVERRLDLTVLSSLTLDIINEVNDLALTRERESLRQSRLATRFMLSGFSWRYAEFRIWVYRWEDRLGRFARHQGEWNKGPFRSSEKFRFIGDHTGIAKEKLRRLLQNGGSRGQLDMEPFAVLLEMIRDANYSSIGGAPQLVKIYRHMNSQAFTVNWPSKLGESQATYAGRALFPYEQTAAPNIDPDNPRFE